MTEKEENIMSYYTKKRYSTYRPYHSSSYKSHCWNCGNPIDGSWNRKCPKCNTYYICPRCGKCKCDWRK